MNESLQRKKKYESFIDFIKQKINEIEVEINDWKNEI